MLRDRREANGSVSEGGMRELKWRALALRDILVEKVSMELFDDPRTSALQYGLKTPDGAFSVSL